jgi:hypothetical protein
MLATSVFVKPGYASAPNRADLRHYFEHSGAGLELALERLEEVHFGEFLVAHGLLDRYQLFRALQMQDRKPGVRLGEAAVALGFASSGAIERMHDRFEGLATIDVA